MKRHVLLSVATAMVLGVLAPQANAGVDVHIGIDLAPPPPRVEVIHEVRPGYVWAPGYWQWVGHEHHWVTGRWLPARPGYAWVPARWERYDYGYRFQPGHWRHAHYPHHHRHHKHHPHGRW